MRKLITDILLVFLSVVGIAIVVIDMMEPWGEVRYVKIMVTLIWAKVGLMRVE